MKDEFNYPYFYNGEFLREKFIQTINGLKQVDERIDFDSEKSYSRIKSVNFGNCCFNYKQINELITNLNEINRKYITPVDVYVFQRKNNLITRVKSIN